MQSKVVHSSDTWDGHIWIPATAPIHQGTTNAAEMIGHCIARGDSAALGEDCDLVLTADMFECTLLDHEIGCKH